MSSQLEDGSPHLSRIQVDPRLDAPEPVLLLVRLTDKQQRVEGDRRVGAEVQAVEGGLVVAALELEESSVHILGNVRLGHGPDGLHRVHLLAVQDDCSSGHERS